MNKMQRQSNCIIDEELKLESYEAMIAALPQSMFLLDKNKIIIGIFNAAPETLAGIPIEDIVGKSILVYANDPSSPFYQACSMLNDTFDPVFRSGQSLKFQYMILDTHLEAMITKLPGDRILSQVRDISDIVHRQQEIEQRKQKELMIALTAGGLTSWTYDVQKEIISSKVDNNVIGGEMLIGDLLQLVEPCHRHLVGQLFGEIIEFKRDHAQITVQVRDRTGKLQWTDVHAMPHEYDAQGRVTHIIGSQKNVTEEYLHNEKLEELIRQKEMTLKELDAARKRAEQSDALKSAFLANMSHEIRTPLNALVGFSQLIAESEDREERTSYMNIIQSNSELLLTLINDILDLSKIEAGYAEYNNAFFDLEALTCELEITIRSKLKPGVQLINRRSDSPCFVLLDKSRVKQLYINFLTNACKFTAEGAVEMGYVVENGGVRLYVKDSGCGIAEEHQSKIFERFEKLDTFTQGTGLGMSICKAIADAYNGRIGLESRQGEGSLFWVWLPTEISMEQELSMVGEQQISHFCIKNRTQSRSSVRILLAEDIDSNYELIRAMLKGYDLTRVNNGVEAVEQVRNGDFDLILMDIRMPVMDGLEATRTIRTFDQEVPIVAISAHTSESDGEQAMKAGCDAFLHKPVSREKLLEMVIWGR